MFKIVRPIAALVISVLILFFFVRPMYVSTHATQAESTQYAEVLDRATEFNRLLDDLNNKQKSLSALERERLDMFVPQTIDEIRALVDLEYLAGQHGMSFRDVTAELAAADGESSGNTARTNDAQQASTADSQFSDRLQSRDVTFTVLGTYEQFRAFLRDVERSLVLMEIVHISFGDNGGGELTNYQVTVRLYGLTPITPEQANPLQ